MFLEKKFINKEIVPFSLVICLYVKERERDRQTEKKQREINNNRIWIR
jgi:hypothetical protein